MNLLLKESKFCHRFGKSFADTTEYFCRNIIANSIDKDTN